jgi:ornithine cyclodeaminase/alanine dehydrogenase-like protein (mu-crystallin family)
MTTEARDFLIIRKEDIAALASMDDLLHVAAQALRKTSSEVAVQDVRRVLELPDAPGACLSVMYAAIADQPLFGAKVLSVMPTNFDHGLPSHRGVIVLFERRFGRPVALVDGGEATAWRTAAASAVATRALARANASSLALLGYGEQAARHVQSIAAVRPIRSIRVWGRDPDKAAAFASRQRFAGFDARAFPDAAQAVAGADIVCTVTSSAEPVLRGEWLKPGTHVNAVGASVPSCREIDADCVRRAGIWVDYLPMALSSAGELVDALRTGLITRAHIRGEIGAVLNGELAGRQDDDEITLYRSLGVPAQDLEIANFLYASAVATGSAAHIQL